MKRTKCVLVFLLILTSCVHTEIIDQIALVQTIAVDDAGEDGFEKTVTFPVFLEQGEESLMETKALSTTSSTLKEAKTLLNMRSQRPVSYGQIRTVIIEDDYAEKGLEHIVEPLYRDPLIGYRLNLAIFDVNTKDVIETIRDRDKERAGVMISEMIDQNQEHENIPHTDLHRFLFTLYSDGRDPVLPLMTTIDDHPAVQGIGVLTSGKGKLVHTLDLKESFLLKLLLSGSKEGTQIFNIEEGPFSGQALIDQIDSKRRIKVNEDGTHYEISLDLKGVLTDFTGETNTDEPKLISAIEKTVKREVKDDMENLVKTLQEKGVDPIGFGEKYRSQTRDWNAEMYYDTLYENFNFDVDVKMQVIQTGAIE
ncbi:spore germination protein [Salsuginibacillus halophilus]|uniref:Spore germination protein n=1 Tax=Salsuginibacillus halophilus TaxID=517424 RepID=A0A2P8HW34_9BACI|nr:Ger(x)C family spore germination protein [Salsuginibacillus halophilus]PSL50451.1 spore germination protein [Salsuginibacillus halophilus]